MDEIIQVKDIVKVFKVHEKEESLKGSIKSIFKRKFKYVEALNNVTFNINKGEIIGYIGPNGAGKTTTLKILSGLLHPTSGDVNVSGFKPWQRKNSFKMKISFVMGNKTQLWWDIPAVESLILNKEIYRIGENDFNNRLDFLSNLLEIKDLLNIPVRNLSLGERMKMELICSLIHNPEILFLDEPTLGLDVSAQKRIRDFIKLLNKEQKTTIILTSHYMRDVEELCDRIIIINKGKIIFDNKLEILLNSFSNNKTIKIKFFDEIPKKLINTKNMTIHDSQTISIFIDKKKINNFAREIFSQYNVEDISILDKPLEEIVKEICS